MIIEKTQAPGLQLYAPDSPEAEDLLAERGLSPGPPRRRPCRAATHPGHPDPDHRRHQRGRRVRPPSRGLAPDLPDACAEPFIPLLWLQVLELLGRVPKGSTARFREDGTLPDDVRMRDPTPPYRWDCVPTAAWHVRGAQAGRGWFLRSLPAMAPAADPPVPPPCLDR